MCANTDATKWCLFRVRKKSIEPACIYITSKHTHRFVLEAIADHATFNTPRCRCYETTLYMLGPATWREGHKDNTESEHLSSKTLYQ